MVNFIRKALFAALLLSVAVSPLVGREAGAAADPLTPEERAFVAAHGPIRYAPDPLFPPFEFLDPSGVARGITPDLLAIMGRNLGVEFRTVAYHTWSDVLEAVQHGKVDLLGTLTRTPEREGFLFFSKPYLSVPYVLFIRQGGDDPKTVDDLVSRRLGVVKNYGINTWLSAAHPKIRPVTVEDTATGLTMVATGQLDALLETLPVGAQIVREKSLTNIRIVPRHIYTLPQHFGVFKGEPLLLSIVQKGLDSLTETERSEAFMRWTGQDFSHPPPAISSFLMNLIVVLAAAAVFSWVWIVALRRSVRRATQSLRENEDVLRTNKENLKLALRSANMGMWSWEIAADRRIFDGQVCALLGLDPAKFGGEAKEFMAAVHPDDREKIKAAMARTIEQSVPYQTEYRAVWPDGSVHDICARGRIVREDSGRPLRVIGIVWDVTDRKRAEEEKRRMEERLLQSAKMEAVGRLAGGVAHDFNNLLTAIIGYSEFLDARFTDGDPSKREIGEIRKAADRAASLTRQLLAYSRRQVLQPQVIGINSVISEIDPMLRRLIGEHIAFATKLDGALWDVKADPGQMSQVVMNLAINARDAMPDGGKLTIETANATLGEEYHRNHEVVEPGPYVMLAVSDTGIGMSEETTAHIFEPFFTTKEMGKGTGLGLSTVYGIVKQSKGYIWVYSEPGHGTTFKVYLPRTDEGEALPDKPVSPVEDMRGEKTVLLVEDDEPIRKLAREVLEQNGYAVLSAGDGEEALRVAGEYRGEIHLLLTDVVMPGIGGRELSDRIRALRPAIRIIYMSGYTGNAIADQGVLALGTPFLQKPYSPASLARKVKEVLEEE